MEVSNEGDGDPKDISMASSTANSPEQDMEEQQPANKKVSREVRDVSVDMLAEETGPRLGRDVYQTPQTGSDDSSGINSAIGGLSPAVVGRQGSAPPLDAQIAIITKAIQEVVEDGMKGYIISAKWLAEAQDRGTAATKSSKEAQEEVQPPVDNRDLVDTSLGELQDANGNKFFPLKPGLQIDRDIQILPEAAWNKIVQWYGVVEGSPDIIRWCHNTSEGAIENLQYEMNPPIFTLVKLAWLSDGLSKDAMFQKSQSPVRIVASRHEKIQDFLKRAKSAAHTKTGLVRVWTTAENVVTSLKNAGMPTPAHSRSASPAPGSLQAINIGDKLILDPATFNELPDGAAQMSPVKDETSNPNYNGSATLDLLGLARPGVLILEEQIGGPAGGEWITEASKATLAKHGITKNSSSTLKPTASGRSSPAPTSMMTRGRAKKGGRPRGAVGLGNLGNTCYMNAALQCIRAVRELTYYFLENKWQEEVNHDNPLGYNGQIAKVYADLLKEIYTPGTTSVSPRQFKHTVGRSAATFSGYGQQDSQEFIGWLLDALQEDLNRIQKKPYVEKPDSTDEMIHNPALLKEFAEKCWNIYKARNDSVITDLFAGMYKSTLHCPVCDKISIIFDPFNNLTLQLPLENAWHYTVYFYPISGRPHSLEVDISRNATWSAVKEYVASKFETDPKRLILAEAYGSKFWKYHEDRGTIGEESSMNERDYIVFYEQEAIPSNYPPKAGKPKSMLNISSDTEDEEPAADTSVNDSIAFPVFFRVKNKNPRSSKDSGRVPIIISLKRSDLGDEDEILRAILLRLNGLTTVDFLSDGEESPEDEDTMVVSTSDAESGSDKIRTESHEDFVEIDTILNRKESGPRISYPARDPIKKSKSHPKCLQRGAFIPNNIRSLFTIGLFREGNESIPKGSPALTDDFKKFHKLDNRILNRDQKRANNGNLKAGEQLKRAIANGGSDAGSEDELSSNGVTFVASTEDDDSRVDNVHRPNNGGFKKRSNVVHTYSKRDRRHAKANANRKRAAQGRARSHSMDGTNSEMEDEVEDETHNPRKPALIRPGEGIVLEWDAQAWEHVFGEDDSHMTVTDGREIVFPNPEATAKKADRDRKLKNGVTLDDCLNELEQEEILSEADAWYCPRCKAHRRASKKFEIWSCPDVLIVHLKRFTSSGRSKLDLNVEFPLEGLDMTKRVVVQEDGRELIYDLIGVDNHFGGLGGGHYTALALNFENDQWYDFNDTMASPKSEPESQFSGAAYILFYRRRSFKPLGGPLFEDLFATMEADTVETASNLSSRAESPSGEGQRLEDSSRGFSSAYQDQEAVHLAGNGGVQASQRITTRSMARIAQDSINDDAILPSYEDSTLEIDETPALPWTEQTTWGWDTLRASGQSPSDNDNDSLRANPEESDEDRDNILLSGPSDFIRRGTPIGSDSLVAEERTPSVTGDKIPTLKIGQSSPDWDEHRSDTVMDDDVHEIRP